ncbi:MAG: glycoside hydrolase family 20 zincin-like fold domain-containing protein, partial [Planctomycetota bacterium]|nr:glycoside hydrolase family 20 zincin-like fold domain-containing protein [Planctomycetota bacterium]
MTYPEGCTVNLPWALGKPHDQVWLWDESDPLQLSFELDPNLVSDQAYRLEIRPQECVIRGGGELGFLYGAITLNQWISQHPQGTPIHCVTIEDAPKIERRGYMLDVSRDRMPTMDRLHELIEQLARLKYNHLELYLEHTFEYAGHESVSDGASPITPDEMRVLVGSARWHGIEMVPNQNTFGHMHRWLTLPAYNHLAEEPGGTLHAFDFRKEPFGLCAANPESLRLVDDLVGQLWPLFDSEFFNAGLDATFDLGRGGSAELCAEKG